VVLSTSIDAVLKQTAALRGRSTEDVVSTANREYLSWKDCDEANSAIRIGNIELDPPRRLVRKNSAVVRLTPTEFDLLHYLMLHAGLAMAHARILGASWAWSTGVNLSICEPTSASCGRSWKMIPQNPSTCLLTLVTVIDSRT
jgi:DNA-binding response OmpR family regulator